MNVWKPARGEKLFQSLLPWQSPDRAKPPFQRIIGDKPRHSYMLQDPAHFLTAWAPTTEKLRYADDNLESGPKGEKHMFAKCYKQTPQQADGQFQIPSGCVEGGRSGYSIKLVSCNFVKRHLRPRDSAFLGAACPP